MAISKRLRFEVLKRDRNTCQACGAQAPDVALQIDHVTPVALGGSDDPSNLQALCVACNSGKSASNPEAPVVAAVSESARRWSLAMQEAGRQMLADVAAVHAAHEQFDKWWHVWSYGKPKKHLPRPDDWRQSVDSFLAAGLPLEVLKQCIDLAGGNNRVTVDQTWRYMCGIAWKKVTELQESARAMADRPTGSAAVHPAAVVAFCRTLLEDYADEWNVDDMAAEYNLYLDGRLTGDDRLVDLVRNLFSRALGDRDMLQHSLDDMLKCLPADVWQESSQQAQAQMVEEGERSWPAYLVSHEMIARAMLRASGSAQYLASAEVYLATPADLSESPF